MILEIWYNGIKLDMFENETVSFTFQVNDIADFGNRQSTYTNSFNLPKTPKNVQAFKGLSLPSDNSKSPYQVANCVLKLEGFDISIRDYLNIKESSDVYKVYIYSGIVDLFKSLENKYIGTHLAFPYVDNIYKDSYSITLSWQDPNIKYLIASYGGKTHYQNGGNTIINTDYLFPSIRLKYLWDLIFQMSGFEYEGTLFQSEDFQSIYITFPNGRDEEFNAPFSFKEVMADFPITDLVKDVVNIFGLTIYPDKYEKKLIFKTTDERFQGIDIIDWSYKFIERKSEDYTYDSYAARNTLRWKYDENSTNFNNGAITIDNETLDEEKTLFTSKFYTHQQNPVFFSLGSEVYLSPVFKLIDKQRNDSGAEVYKALSNRYMLIRAEQKTGEIRLGSKSDNSAGYLFDGDYFVGSSKDLGFRYFVQKYYKGIETILNDSRIHKIDIDIDLVDILKLDLDKVYYFEQEQQNYILNKLNWKTNQNTGSGEFVRLLPYALFEQIDIQSFIKFEDYETEVVYGTLSQTGVLNLGLTNLGILTIVNQEWFISNSEASYTVPYSINPYDMAILPGRVTSTFLRSYLSDGSIVQSNTLQYFNTVQKRCFKGRYFQDDPIHGGGKIWYIDGDGNEQYEEEIYADMIITIFAIEIIRTELVVSITCP